MGVPAFDMSAFDAAQAAVSASPRASTSVSLGIDDDHRSFHNKHQNIIRSDIDQFIGELNHWRIAALVEFSNMESEMEFAFASASLGVLQDLLPEHRRRKLEMNEFSTKSSDIDKRFIEEFSQTVIEATKISNEVARFLRRQHKRLLSAGSLRADVFRRLLARWDKLEEAIQRNIEERVAIVDDAMPRVVETFGSIDKARNWLSKASPALDHNSPIEVLTGHDGLTKIKELLVRIDHGLAA